MFIGKKTMALICGLRKVVEELSPKKEEEDALEENVVQDSVSEKGSLYDSKGILLQSGLDMCDCLEVSCPGCHFPCSNCSSLKCGHMCRSSLKF